MHGRDFFTKKWSEFSTHTVDQVCNGNAPEPANITKSNAFVQKMTVLYMHT